MVEDKVFSTVQYIRELVRDKYNFAMGTFRFTWVERAQPSDFNAVMKLNILLGEVFTSNGKRARLEKLATLATVLGWNNGTGVDSLWGSYEDLKKKLGRVKGAADRAYREIEKDALKVWGLASTKDLWLAEIYAFIEAMEEEPDAIPAIKAISRDPKAWVKKLARLRAVERPSTAMFMPPPPINDSEELTDFDLSVNATAEELYGPAFEEEETPW
jgi:hypothetical protein